MLRGLRIAPVWVQVPVWAFALLCVLALALPAAAQSTDATEQARARWEQMTPEERAEIKRRFEALRELDEGGRKELERRHKNLKRAERTAVDELPAEVREQLDSLEPKERRAVLREVAKDALEQEGRAIRERLPAEVRSELEQADPARRRQLLDEMKRSHRPERMERAVEKLERELDLPKGERRRLDDLPPRERESRLFELHRRRVEREVEGKGLPDWIGPDEWEQLRGLGPREFHRRLDRQRRDRGAGSFREAFGPGRRGGGPMAGREGAGREGAGREGSGKPNAQLGDLLRPDPAWRIELRGLSATERRDAMQGRIRERALKALSRGPETIDPAELARLRALEGEAFIEALRGLRGGRRVEGRGEGRPEGPRHRRGEGPGRRTGGPEQEGGGGRLRGGEAGGLDRPNEPGGPSGPGRAKGPGGKSPRRDR